MQNENGENVDLYIPRKCSWTNRLIRAKDHGSVQINVANVDPVTGLYTGETTAYALAGYIRDKSEGDMALTALVEANDKKAAASQDTPSQPTPTMTNRYDDLERRFGISAYASPHQGFAAVVKARYSDFVVHEVDLNGNVARLESVEMPRKDDSKGGEETPSEANANGEPDAAGEQSRKRKLPETSDRAKSNAATEDKGAQKDDGEAAQTMDWEVNKRELSKFIDEKTAEEVVSFLQQPGDDNASDVAEGDVQKFYSLPPISEKDTRRSVHHLIKSPAFNTIARADNHEGRIRIWHIRYKADMPKDNFGGGNNGRGGDRNNSKQGRKGGADRKPWPKDRPDFLRFVMYKENIDTGVAAKDVCRTAHLNPKRGIGYAGMKDKRGITTQFCSVYRMEKEQLLAVNARGGNDGAGGGNTSKSGASIIKLGSFAYSSEEVRLGRLSGNRFDIVLRNVDVGEDAGQMSRHLQVQQKLEKAGVALKDRGFVNYFGMQRFGKFNDTHLVGIAVLKGDFEGAVGIIMREKTNEWPRIAEARRQWATRFDSIDVANDEDAAREAEMKCARAIQRDLGRFMMCEKSIANSLSRKPRDYKRAFGSISKNMRSMFLHAYQSYLWNKVASHRIESGGSTEVRAGDLILVEEGQGGSSGLKGKVVKVLDEQDVKDGRYRITDVVLPLAGSKVRYPEGPSGEQFDALLKEDGISKSDFARIGSLDRELSLGGDYRKLICHPNDVTFQVLQYSDPLQPLLQTDLMKANGVDVTATTLGTDNTEKPDDAKMDVEGDGTDGALFAMIVGFSLPPSSYATIALRELTKRPTSGEYQTKLELSGRCERNID
ncbi:hypothetical protein ACHAXT_004420 [Thalassiosira profunda]